MFSPRCEAPEDIYLLPSLFVVFSLRLVCSDHRPVSPPFPILVHYRRSALQIFPLFFHPPYFSPTLKSLVFHRLDGLPVSPKGVRAPETLLYDLVFMPRGDLTRSPSALFFFFYDPTRAPPFFSELWRDAQFSAGNHLLSPW